MNLWMERVSVEKKLGAILGAILGVAGAQPKKHYQNGYFDEGTLKKWLSAGAFRCQTWTRLLIGILIS